MSFEKNGMVTENSQSDFDLTKKAKYYDEMGTGIADENNKDKLTKPAAIIDFEAVKHKSPK
jgi:hypothetical protein